MTNIVTPPPTPVFVNADGVSAPEGTDGWTVQAAAGGSNQNLVTNPPD